MTDISLSLVQMVTGDFQWQGGRSHVVFWPLYWFIAIIFGFVFRVLETTFLFLL